ncbi:PREDICTED: uncharacterized protein LOC109219755 [Nicotiana attenuata]|uniref:Uncharacterized protein n=1 Tax=Nicotiana attenuata TaxID=49451 RepID=A0A1J6JSQ5_NICAT|nr:PREDICTED: uncharacterized protein LOC109219755 [Nicotiana attenuata]XP_019239772.1 PREDICTED: uncharacterized protein LOC109219755 [Nicotiana attenuata]XP_019239773.1 PREDICTED: uncharacterized protein LOC109219755 [Nicotiana attenuata]OIT20770.1 hypothetical protein A4A49_37342 [Nicotiana attenuata]
MPKDRRVNSSSLNGARASPYACSSKNTEQELKSSLPPVGNEREWKEARCPICMEHPHNCVLLLCSSRDKGCLPYMCDTSYRHSNCLDQFCKLSSGTQSEAQPEGSTISGTIFHRASQGQPLSRTTWSTGGQQPELVCPLCRGQIKGWIVVEAARKFMNSKQRSCSLETCNFNGNYGELRKHARLQHPSDRPAKADPQRQYDWRRLELQRDFGDTLSAYQTPFGDDFAGDDLLTELPLDGGLFDLLDGYTEAEDGLSEDGNLLLDLEFELPFSFLNDFPFLPLTVDEFSEFDSGRSPTRSRTSARSDNRRDWRSTSSDNQEERPATTRDTNRSSRRMPSSFFRH